jgi:uncharacterized RDD family membrane protein YckC
MGVIKVPTTFNIEVEFEIPEFYRRLISLLIDMAIQFCYFKIAQQIIISVERGSDPFDRDTGYNLGSFEMLMWLPLALYHIVLEITMNGQSIGKKIMGMRVVSENGGRASFSQFFIRWLLRLSDLWIVFIVLLIIIAPFFFSGLENTLIILAALAFLVTDIVLVVSSKKGQRIGDILAHTILIRTNTRSSIEETVFQEVADTYKPAFPQIMQLSDKDINAIKSILETAKKRGDFNMAAVASEKIKAHLKIDSSMSPFDFLDVLLKDYNYLSVK